MRFFSLFNKMPTGDSLQLVVIGSGVGVGFLAGACYLMIHGYKWFEERRKNASQCYICQQIFTSNSPNQQQSVTCFICGRRVCRPPELDTIFEETNPIQRAGTKCSRFDSSLRRWRCYICSKTHSLPATPLHQRIGNNIWLRNNDLYFQRVRMNGNNIESCSAILAAQEEQLEHERRRIREVLEGRAQSMVGGSLDDVSVGYLYAHAQYERMFAKYHNTLSNALSNLATTLHANNISQELPRTRYLTKSEENSSVSLAELGLRDAVRRVAREAAKLPCLAGTATGNQLASYGREDTTYEDLLATAILNKVIDSFQKDNQNIASPTESVSSSRRSSKSYTQRPTIFDDNSDLILDNNKKPPLQRQSSLPNTSCSVQVNPLHRNDSFEQYDADEQFSLHSEPPVHFQTGSYLPKKNAGVRKRRHLNRNSNQDIGSLSSLEDYIPRFQRDDNFSFMIKQSIDELTSSDVDESYDPQMESDEASEANSHLSYHSTTLFKPGSIKSNSMHDINDDNDIPSSILSEPWEDNWLFQKKSTKNPVISTPVAMLVPNASIEYRALIGDRDAEDTTDLSDIGSDYDEPGKDISKNDIKSVLVTSRTIIGGKNDLNLLNETSINEEGDEVNVSIEIKTEPGSINSNIDEINTDLQTSDTECNRLQEEIIEVINTSQLLPNEDNINQEIFIESTVTTNEEDDNETGCETNVNIEINDNSESNFESLSPEVDNENITEATNATLINDTPYSESDSFDSNLQKDTELDEQIENTQQSKTEEITSEPKKSTNNKYNYDSGIDINDPPPVKGTIAEREHKKWENAVPMPNNPYTVENIEKRLKERSYIALPQVTSLERRNSYKKDINSIDTEDNISSKSIESINSSSTHLQKNAVQKMFDDIVRDYSLSTTPSTDKNEQSSLEIKSNSMHDLNNDTNDKSKKMLNNNDDKYLSTLNYNFEKTQSCINLGMPSKDDEKLFHSSATLKISDLQRSASTNQSGTYLKDLFNDDTNEIKRFGRDYYIREAKRASGSRKASKESLQKSSSDVKDLITSNSDFYCAKTVIVKEEETEIQNNEAKSPNHIEVGDLLSLEDDNCSSPNSSINDVERVYNINSGVVLYQNTTSPDSLSENRNDTGYTSPDNTSTSVSVKVDEVVHESPTNINSFQHSEAISAVFEEIKQNGIRKNLKNMDRENSVNPPDLIRETINNNNESFNSSLDSNELINNENYLTLEQRISNLNNWQLNKSTDTLEMSVQENLPNVLNETSEIDTCDLNHTTSCNSIKSTTSYSSGINNDIEISERSSPALSMISSPDKTLNSEMNEYESEIETSPSIIPTVKERMKRFLSTQNLKTCDDKFHPNHSITARSILRRSATSSSSQLQLSTSDTNDKPIQQYQSLFSPDFPRQSLKERRAFFENLNK